MKIFPLRPLSNYDRFINMIKFMDHVQVSRSSGANKYGIDVKVDTEHYIKEGFLNSIKEKYRIAIKEIVTKMKGSHGEKSIIG